MITLFGLLVIKFSPNCSWLMNVIMLFGTYKLSKHFKNIGNFTLIFWKISQLVYSDLIVFVSKNWCNQLFVCTVSLPVVVITWNKIVLDWSISILDHLNLWGI